MNPFTQYIKSLLVIVFLGSVSLDCSAWTKEIEVGPAYPATPVQSPTITRPIIHRPSILDAIIQVESNGNVFAIGDLNRTFHAYGPLQIRMTVIQDVNRVYRTCYTPEECYGNLPLSRDIFSKYELLYATEQNVGRKVEVSDIVRIWNGGPKGFRKQSTMGYWQKVKSVYAQLNKEYTAALAAKAEAPSLAAR